MNKEIEDALHTLLHCSLKDTEYETQVEQYKIVRKYITNLQQENKKYKEVIDNLKMRISARIKKYEQKIDNEIDMGSKGDCFKICRYEENIKFLKDILKEVE